MPFYDNFFTSDRSQSTPVGRWLVRYRNNWFINKIRALTKKEGVSILEIGPGKGDFADLCLEKNWGYLGIEGNTLMFDRLKERGINVLNRYVPPIDVNERFDVVYLNQVLEHMETRDQAINLIQEIYSILAEGGIVVISSPEITFWGGDFFAGDYTHNNPTSFYNVKQLLVDFSFTIVDINFYTLIFEGYYLCRFLSLFYRFLYSTFIIDLILGREKAYKVLTALLPSAVVVGQRHSSFESNT